MNNDAPQSLVKAGRVPHLLRIVAVSPRFLGIAGLLPGLLLAFLASPAVAEERLLRLGVVSERADQPDYVLKQYAPLLAYLNQKLAPRGLAVAPLVITKDVSELGSRFVAGEIDLAFESLFPLFAMQRAQVPVKPLLAAWRKGKRETSSIFFVRGESKIKRLDDLRGKRLALESQRSTTAFALPLATLWGRGIASQPSSEPVRKGAVRYLLAGGEENQAYWVSLGKADAGAFNIEDWDGLPESLRQNLRIIHTSEPLLRWLLLAHASLDADLVRPLEALLLEMHEDPDGHAALQSARRIARFDRLAPLDLKNIERWRRMAAIGNRP